MITQAQIDELQLQAMDLESAAARAEDLANAAWDKFYESANEYYSQGVKERSRDTLRDFVGNRRTCRSCGHWKPCRDDSKYGLCAASRYSNPDRIITDAYPECPLWVANA